jgi:hypothetical protein
VVIELWAVEAFVLRLLLLVLRKQLLCAFLSLIVLCGWCVAYVADASVSLLRLGVIKNQLDKYATGCNTQS